MDYLGWELARQRAALLALLGGGEPEKEAPREAASLWDGEAAPEETESRETAGRSREWPGEARRRAPGKKAAAFPAGGRGEKGSSPEGAPGAWEIVREAERAALDGGAGGPAAPAGAWEEFLGGEAGGSLWEERTAGAEASAAGLRQRAPAGRRRTLRAGTDGSAAERLRLSGRREAGTESGETAAEAAGRKRAEDGPAAGREAPLRYGGREAAGGETLPEYGGGRAFRYAALGGSRTVPPGGYGPAETAGEGERLFRALPWGDGRENPILRAEAGARALSRAVQRDARRYDGGFTIY